jgi:hypothetical protein
LRALTARFAVVFAFVLAGCAGNFPGLNQLNFSNAELTSFLAKRFPVEKSIAGLLDVTLTRPQVEAREDAGQALRLGASFDVSVKMALTNKTIVGKLGMSGVPRYDVATRSIFLRDARVDSLRADGMPDALSAAVAKAASTIAKEYLEDKPLRTFAEHELSLLGVRLNPQRIEVGREGIRLMMQ